jgi:hypothetical protein
VLRKHIPFIFGLSVAAMGELPSKLAGRTLITGQLNIVKNGSVRNWRLAIATSSSYTLVAREIRSRKASCGPWLFFDFPSKSAYWKKFVMQRGLQPVEINIF